MAPKTRITLIGHLQDFFRSEVGLEVRKVGEDQAAVGIATGWRHLELVLFDDLECHREAL